MGRFKAGSVPKFKKFLKNAAAGMICAAAAATLLAGCASHNNPTDGADDRAESATGGDQYAEPLSAGGGTKEGGGDAGGGAEDKFADDGPAIDPPVLTVLTDDPRIPPGSNPVCGNCRPTEPAAAKTLQGTSWVLADIAVDGETRPDLIAELYARVTNCGISYTLAFTESSFRGRATVNSFSGNYNVDYAANKISFPATIMTEMCCDAQLWWDAFNAVESFSLQKNELKLYYNGNKNSLIFKPQSDAGVKKRNCG